VYKPPEKRVYGYYVMPILYGTKFIGRLDPKLDRWNRALVIDNLTLEKVILDEGLISKLAMAIRRFLKFHDVSQLDIVKTCPKELKGALMRQV
jgi:hypothetical protein